MTKKYVGSKNGVRIYFNAKNERYYWKGNTDGVLSNPLNKKDKLCTSVGISLHAYEWLTRLAEREKTYRKRTLIRIIAEEYKRHFGSISYER